MSKRLIVTASDRGYFPLARQCILSMVDSAGGADLAVLDLGLDDDQRAFFTALGAVVRRADLSTWPEAPLVTRGSYSRPLLPQLFPDHEHLLWVDADAIILGAEGVEAAFAASMGGAAAVAPELHHAYHRYGCTEPRLNALHLRTTARRFLGNHASLRGPLSYEPYREVYGEVVAESMAFRPVLNIGVLAIRRDAPHWEAWAKELSKAGGRRAPDLMDQVTFNVAMILHDLPVEALSAVYNWIPSKALPIADPQQHVLLTPSPEHETIRILHLAGLPRGGSLRFETVDGGRFEAPSTEIRESLHMLGTTG